MKTWETLCERMPDLKHCYFHSQSGHECSPTKHPDFPKLTGDAGRKMRRAWMMIWFNAVERAEFVLLANGRCTGGADCKNVAKMCTKRNCKRCGTGTETDENCETKPTHEKCDRKCLRSSHNCQLGACGLECMYRGRCPLHDSSFPGSSLVLPRTRYSAADPRASCGMERRGRHDRRP